MKNINRSIEANNTGREYTQGNNFRKFNTQIKNPQSSTRYFEGIKKINSHNALRFLKSTKNR